MEITIAVIGMIGVSVIFVWIKRRRDRQEVEQHSIAPEELYASLDSNREILLYDIRQPLDVLTDSEMIAGAIRIAPRELLQNPSLIPRDKDSVVYCTCPGDETSRRLVRQALTMHYLRTKFLKGGLPGWKARGYPVEPYEESFHLDTRA